MFSLSEDSFGDNAMQHVGSKNSRKTIQKYFVGPLDTCRHSKWPRALRMHGSVTPKLLLITFLVAAWATLITILSETMYHISMHPIITTVLGIIVGLALNFRTSTAYERYMEGRRMWSYLAAISTNLARVIWIHAAEREGERGKHDLIAKITSLNMIMAFAVALKHKLRFEPYIQYDDLNDLVSHLDTFAKSAGEPTARTRQAPMLKRIGELLRIPMAKSNPRKEVKRAKRAIGNLPLEILSYVSAYVHEIVDNGTFKLAIAQTHALNNIQSLNEILSSTDRVLNTPLPIAYTIAISQITWVYILSLPFQLVGLLGWLAIPVTTISAYIILGFAAIGHEIENPFGTEVNDLPMELYCAQIASDITIIASKPKSKPHEYSKHPKNKPLYPISSAGYDVWLEKDEQEIREMLATRASVSKGAMWKRQYSVVSSGGSSENGTVCDGGDGDDGCDNQYWHSGVNGGGGGGAGCV